MTERKKVLPARKPRDRSRDDDSLLLRSAESLGRVIGRLQRQLDVATKRLSGTAGDAWEQLPSMREIAETVTGPRQSTKRRASPRAAKKTTMRKSSGASKGLRKQAASRKRASGTKR